jgi:hypothetical protein
MDISIPTMAFIYASNKTEPFARPEAQVAAIRFLRV